MKVNLRKRQRAQGRYVLYLDYHQNGERVREFLPFSLGPDKKANKDALIMAEAIRSKRQLELLESPEGFIPQHRREQDFVAFYEKVAKSKGRSWSTALHPLKEFTGGFVKLGSVKESWLEAYKEFLLSKVCRNSADTYYAKIKAALRIAVRDGLIHYNPADRVDGIGRVRENPKYLTLEDLHKLRSTDCRNSEIKRAFLFACYTGIRYGDLLALTWGNVRNNSISFVQQKTKQPITFPLHDQAQVILGITGPKEQKLFALPSSHSNMWNVLRQWSRDAGIDHDVSIHAARHTFATLLLSHNTPIYTVSKLLGHTSLQHTQVYAKVIDSEKQKAIESLPVF
jgi:integrase